LQLRHSRLARWRSRPAITSAGAKLRPQPRMDSSFQPRHHLDAGQMGISLVCGMGPRFPHDSIFENRSALREEAAQSFPARMVYAPELPTGGFLQQADGTAWMGFYCLTMLSMALELAQTNPVYEDMASKFFEHFIGISDAMNSLGGSGLWDEEDGFYYDQLKVEGQMIPLRTRSLVGLLPLIAVENLETEKINKLPGFKKRMEWFLSYRKDLAQLITYCEVCPFTGNRMLAIPTR